MIHPSIKTTNHVTHYTRQKIISLHGSYLKLEDESIWRIEDPYITQEATHLSLHPGAFVQIKSFTGSRATLTTSGLDHASHCSAMLIHAPNHQSHVIDKIEKIEWQGKILCSITLLDGSTWLTNPDAYQVYLWWRRGERVLIYEHNNSYWIYDIQQQGPSAEILFDTLEYPYEIEAVR